MKIGRGTPSDPPAHYKCPCQGPMEIVSRFGLADSVGIVHGTLTLVRLPRCSSYFGHRNRYRDRSRNRHRRSIPTATPIPIPTPTFRGLNSCSGRSVPPQQKPQDRKKHWSLSFCLPFGLYQLQEVGHEPELGFAALFCAECDGTAVGRPGNPQVHCIQARSKLVTCTACER